MCPTSVKPLRRSVYQIALSVSEPLSASQLFIERSAKGQPEGASRNGTTDWVDV